eukprot:TRINITY_DN3308_c1_g1_i6.p1 TRINITY_DN3308_c1_g1~~TRINITY_DN3308_c1_g1_i6.p1  ORF type:complete len:137 (-),score=2.57 TRINITY_DN3308_c1_g1_i6:79-450(-)
MAAGASKLRLSLWAPQIGLFACYLLLIGGADCFFYVQGAGHGAYAIVVSLVLIPFLWPWTKLGVLLYVFKNNWIATLLCWGISVWCFFITPLIIGGVVLSLAGVMYLIAGIRGETASEGSNRR